MDVVRKHQQFRLSNEYNALIKRIYPEPSLHTPFGSACVTVEAGTLSKPHLHHEHETFIIVSGRGEFVQDNVRSDISAGDVIYIKPFTEHYIEAHPQSPVEFMSIWWEDGGKEPEARATRQIIFTPPPTPNGDLHLGHISGPYICADIIKRYLLSQGTPASLIVGTDKNQSYVDLKARQKGVSARNVYEQFSQSIMRTFDKAGIGYDEVHDCDSHFHLEFVHDFIQRLLEKDIMQIKHHDSAWCASCRIEVFDAFARGGCPTCGASSNGCVCEDCGSPNNSYNLHDVSCNLCGGTPVARRGNKGVLDLAKCVAGFARAGFQITAPPKLEKYLSEQRAATQNEYVVTFDSAWGVPSRLPELNGQTYLAWIEMAAGYLAALYKSVFGEETSNVEWAIERLNDADFEIIHLMGFDNSFYYAHLYPQLFAALGLRALKITFVVNEFLLLDQSKFSTSRNHAIWANDVFTSPAVADWYRFYLSLKRPDDNRENYESSEFESFRDTTRANLAQLFAVHRQRLDEYFAGDVPQPGSWAQLHQEYAAFFDRHKIHLCNALGVPNGYAVKQYASSVKQLLDVLIRFQRLTTGHFNEAAERDERRTSMFLEAEAMALLRLHLGCIMPQVIRELDYP
jgi:methionyl-tRNA synthetase